jgi:diadenosine tetraphosphate (Ap4A) HIT family hydrolase
MDGCIFCQIIAGHSPASVVYRDDHCVGIMDICPVTTGHVLVMPLRHATHLADLEPRVGGALFEAAQKLAAAIRRSGLKAEGISLLLADGEAAGQEVFHVHLHVLPRFDGDGFGHRFPPHYGQRPPREQLDADAGAIRASLGSVPRT